MEILELKNTVTDIKTTINGFNRLVTAELYNNPTGNTRLRPKGGKIKENTGERMKKETL